MGLILILRWLPEYLPRTHFSSFSFRFCFPDWMNAFSTTTHPRTHAPTEGPLKPCKGLPHECLPAPLCTHTAPCPLPFSPRAPTRHHHTLTTGTRRRRGASRRGPPMPDAPHRRLDISILVRRRCRRPKHHPPRTSFLPTRTSTLTAGSDKGLAPSTACRVGTREEEEAREEEEEEMEGAEELLQHEEKEEAAPTPPAATRPRTRPPRHLWPLTPTRPATKPLGRCSTRWNRSEGSSSTRWSYRNVPSAWTT